MIKSSCSVKSFTGLDDESQLQLRGVELEDGTDSTADPALLLKVMEVNEKLAETRSLTEVNAVGQEVQGEHPNAACINKNYIHIQTYEHLYSHTQALFI